MKRPMLLTTFGFALSFFLYLAVSSFAQNEGDDMSSTDFSATSAKPGAGRMEPSAIEPEDGADNSPRSAAAGGPNTSPNNGNTNGGDDSERSEEQNNKSPGGVDGLMTVPTFHGKFLSKGFFWTYDMMGNDPRLGGTTTIPAKIVAVSLELQNADMVTTTIVPVAPFEELVLDSPNFEEANYTSGKRIQYGDAIQRAEFFNSMERDWHTVLRPTIVDRVTMQVPRFTTLNGQTVRTYFRGTAPDGNKFVDILTPFFEAQIRKLSANEVFQKGNYTTDALNIALLPNTYEFTYGPNGKLVGGFTGEHTRFFKFGNPNRAWVFLWASWISPGLFGDRNFADVDIIAHEIAESLNDPFGVNFVPSWVFFQGSCQNQLETGDPVEVLPHSFANKI